LSVLRSGRLTATVVTPPRPYVTRPRRTSNITLSG
jgi:hypothetical protein